MYEFFSLNDAFIFKFLNIYVMILPTYYTFSLMYFPIWIYL